MQRDSHATVVVRTGSANIASVLAGLRRVGQDASVTDDARIIERARRVVLPGVGAFGTAVRALDDLSLIDTLRERVEAGRATLGICLGMQLFALGSDEAPMVKGLGIWPEQVERFGGRLRTPQLGWNRVIPDSDCRLIESGYAYFANSFRLRSLPVSWQQAVSVYDAPFVAAAEKGNVLVCQFHPELSGAWGMRLLERWVRQSEEE